MKSKYTLHHHISLKENRGDVFVFEWIGDDDVQQKNKGQFQRDVIRFFLKNELNIESEIAYHKSGAPFLKDSNLFISISHSGFFFAVQLSVVDCVGVDIQVFKSLISRGYSYFVNEQEEIKHELNELNLHLIWCAKECVYKLKKGKIKNYREDISIVEIESDLITVGVYTKEIKCRYILERDLVLVFVDNA